jgi:hypothetical protein
MKTTITFEMDADNLGHATDEHLAQIWHIGQANPAAFGDIDACTLVESVGLEIVRRWLAATPPALCMHQPRHILLVRQTGRA